nr:hypothetical protein [Pseudonocardia sp. KRD291]
MHPSSPARVGVDDRGLAERQRHGNPDPALLAEAAGGVDVRHEHGDVMEAPDAVGEGVAVDARTVAELLDELDVGPADLRQRCIAASISSTTKQHCTTFPAPG